MSEKSKRTNRKKIKVITIGRKYEALQQLDAGETAVHIAGDLGVGKSTITNWEKNRTEIEKWLLSTIHAGPSKLEDKS